MFDLLLPYLYSDIFSPAQGSLSSTSLQLLFLSPPLAVSPPVCATVTEPSPELVEHIIAVLAEQPQTDEEETHEYTHQSTYLELDPCLPYNESTVEAPEVIVTVDITKDKKQQKDCLMHKDSAKMGSKHDQLVEVEVGLTAYSADVAKETPTHEEPSQNKSSKYNAEFPLFKQISKKNVTDTDDKKSKPLLPENISMFPEKNVTSDPRKKEYDSLCSTQNQLVAQTDRNQCVRVLSAPAAIAKATKHTTNNTCISLVRPATTTGKLYPGGACNVNIFGPSAEDEMPEEKKEEDQELLDTIECPWIFLDTIPEEHKSLSSHSALSKVFLGVAVKEGDVVEEHTQAHDKEAELAFTATSKVEQFKEEKLKYVNDAVSAYKDLPLETDKKNLRFMKPSLQVLPHIADTAHPIMSPTSVAMSDVLLNTGLAGKLLPSIKCLNYMYMFNLMAMHIIS